MMKRQWSGAGVQFVLAVLLGGVALSEQMVVTGRVTASPHPYTSDSSNKLHFLGKFCFSNIAPHSGMITIETNVRTGSKGTNILLFDDTKWPLIWRARQTISCHEAVGRANNAAMRDAVDWVEGLPIGVSRHSMSINDVIRPHYWYAAAINCNGPMDMSYKLTFVQPDNSQVSFDVQGCEMAYQILAVIMIILMVCHGQAHRWRAPPGYGVTYITSLALACLIVVCLLKMAHLNLQAKNGVGAPFFDALGDLCHAGAFVLIASVFLLASNGWGTVHSQVSESAVRSICLCLVALSGTHLMYLCNSWWFLNEASVVYAYESMPGYLALAAQVMVALYFAATIYDMIKNENHFIPRKHFLAQFALVGMVWWVVVPVTVLIATLLDPYVRAKSVAIMRLIVDGTVLSSLVWLVAPARQDQFFQQASIPGMQTAFTGSSAYDNL